MKRTCIAIGAGLLVLASVAPGSAATISCPHADPDGLTALAPPTPTPGTADCTAEIPGGAIRLKGGRWIGSAPLTGAGGHYRFDDRGRLLSVIDSLGHIVFARPAARLLDVMDSNGVSTQFVYNALGQLLRVAGQGETLASFTYTSSGRVAAIATASGTTAYAYDVIDRLITVLSPAGVSTSITYDLGRVVAIAGGGGSASLSYNERGDLVRINESDQVVSYAYDSLGQLIRVEDNASITEYSYDAGRLLRASSASGTTTYSYDSAGRLVRVVDPNGGVTTYSYDRGRLSATGAPDGSVTRYSYDVAGRLIATTSPSGVTAYSYDSAGNLTSIVDPTSRSTTFRYGVGSLTVSCPSDEPTEPAVLRPPLPSPTTADCVVGIPGGAVRVRDGRWSAEGQLAGGGTYRYDDSGRVFEIADASGNSVPVPATERLIRVVDFAGRATGFAYDSLGRLVATFGPAGTQGTYSYGAGSGGGKVSFTTDPFGAVTSYAYDATGRLTQVMDASGVSTAFVYAADGIISVSELTGSTGLTYSSGNDLVRVSGPSQTVSYTYDAPGRLVSVIDPAGNTTTYSYSDGRLLTAESTAGVTSYTYDAAGNLTRVTNPRGAVTAYGYEEGRLATELAPTGTTIEYSYSASGQLVMVANSSKGITRYSYDATSRTTAVVDRLSRTTNLVYGQTTLYSTSGFLAPIAGDGMTVLKTGATVPVKFQLTGPSAGIIDLQAEFFFALAGQPQISGGFFRFDPQAGQYVVQWKTKGLATGHYLLRADLGGGQSITAHVILE